MTRSLIVAAGSLLVVGCGNVNDPAPDGGPTTDCTPSTTTCANDAVTVCSASGAVESTQPCGLGCAAAGDRCADLAPSNGLGLDLDMAATAPDIVFNNLADDTLINTDTGDVTHDGAPVPIPSVVRSQAGAPSIRVFRVKSLMAFNRIVVRGANAIAIVSHGDVVIRTGFDVAASRQVPGPGAFVAPSPCHGGDATVADPAGTTTRVPGAGGGGLGGAGGRGGNANKVGGTISLGAAGGPVSGSVDLQPLRGGCRGGGVQSTDPSWVNAGGGGGGAVQISSRGQITVSGVINAGGGGGSPGQSGVGGGSGGGILLEASAVAIDGRLVANGGGGSCAGIGGQNAQTLYGVDGKLEAAGGDCDDTIGLGDGGAGGSKDLAAIDGGLGNSGTAVPIGGGGGGGVGRIRINTHAGAVSKAPNALVTPLAVEAAVQTR